MKQNDVGCRVTVLYACVQVHIFTLYLYGHSCTILVNMQKEKRSDLKVRFEAYLWLKRFTRDEDSCSLNKYLQSVILLLQIAV